MRFHFISGLPRSGSTLLAAILRQNPAFHAGIESPVAEIFSAALRAMSMSEGALFLSDGRRQRILRSIVDSYYADINDKALIFDTHRTWCSLLSAVAGLFPESRVICCIRNPAWILDSAERLIQRNAFIASRMFGHDVGNVYTRVDALTKHHFLGASMNGLRQAWHSEWADRLIAVQFDSLTAQPQEVINQLYDLLGEPRFPHDFEHLEYEEVEFDARIGIPGLHKVATRVETRTRTTILPNDLFSRYDREFWKAPGQNPRDVKIL